MPNEPQVVILPVLDTTTIVNFLVGVFLPLAIAYAQSWRATSRYKAAFSFGACVAVSLLTTILAKSFAGEWSGDAAENLRLIVFNVVALLMSAWSLFARLYQPLGVIAKLEQSGPQAGAPTP